MATNYGRTIQLAHMGPTMRVIGGVDCVADDIITRLQTPFLWYDETGSYGFALDDLVNSAVNGTTIASSALARLENQVRQDPRVAKVNATSTFSDGLLDLRIAITLSNGESFTLIGKPFGSYDTEELLFSVQKGGT